MRISRRAPARERGQKGAEIAPGCDPATSATISGRPWATTRPAGITGLGPKIDDPVGPLDDVEVMLDHDDGVTRIDQAVEYLDQDPDVVEVEAGRGLDPGCTASGLRACRPGSAPGRS